MRLLTQGCFFPSFLASMSCVQLLRQNRTASA
jgi:hypothetical protein